MFNLFNKIKNFIKRLFNKIKNYYKKVIMVRIGRMNRAYIVFKKRGYKIITYPFRFCRFWIKTYYRYAEKPKNFYRQIPIYFTIAFIWPSKKRIKLFTWWSSFYIGKFFRNSLGIAISIDYSNPHLAYYLKINFVVFFIIKMWQEVYMHFTCPLATLLYGKLKKRKKRLWQIKQEERERKKKLHKFNASPFITKAERKKRQDAIDKKEKRKGRIFKKRMKKKDELWRYDIFDYRKIETKQRVTMRKKKKWFFF